MLRPSISMTPVPCASGMMSFIRLIDRRKVISTARWTDERGDLPLRNVERDPMQRFGVTVKEVEVLNVNLGGSRIIIVGPSERMERVGCIVIVVMRGSSSPAGAQPGAQRSKASG